MMSHHSLGRKQNNDYRSRNEGIATPTTQVPKCPNQPNGTYHCPKLPPTESCSDLKCEEKGQTCCLDVCTIPTCV
ncbi:hypothetical protein V5799_011587 [Amblyomma americanum]|uniref:Uncharacterized protein n=1 Tax=Amblyomma americanum TaxID=6943 RepID=A0AAQ4EGU7_AMBAM